MESTSLTRLLAYAAAGFTSLLLVTGLIVISWTYARPAEGNPASRLRWHMITKNKIAKGTQIKADDVTWTLGRVSEKDPLIPIFKTIVGKYAKTDIEPNSTCVPELLSDLALADPPPGGVVVPIEAKTSDVSSLKPGMRLAFVQEGKGIQPGTTLLSKKDQPGLMLLSITASPKDEAATTLFVEVEKSNLASVKLLVIGTWRPVILGVSEVVEKQQPVKRRIKRKPVRPRARRKG